MKGRSLSSVLNPQRSKKSKNWNETEAINARQQPCQSNGSRTEKVKKMKVKSTDATTDSGSVPTSSEMGLDEIELSQGSDEQNETDIDHIPFNWKTGLEKNVESLYEMNSDLNVVQRSQHHDSSFTPQSIRR